MTTHVLAFPFSFSEVKRGQLMKIGQQVKLMNVESGVYQKGEIVAISFDEKVKYAKVMLEDGKMAEVRVSLLVFEGQEDS